jgi:hypothetical protein
MRQTWLATFILLAPSLAFAQHPPASTSPLPAPGVQLPDAPAPDDGMLQPIPPAARSVASWDDALGYIRARSVDLKIAQLEVARAEAQSRQALAGVLPTLTGSATGTHNFITNTTSQISGLGAGGTPTFSQVQSPNLNYATGNLIVGLPLIVPRAWNALTTASMNENVAKLSVEDAKRNIALNVANAIVGAVTAERISELNRVGLKSALQRLDLTKRKNALGAATGLDVIRARQDVESARATLITGDESVRQGREALGLALGVAEAVGVARGVDLDGIATLALASCKPAAKLDERPDLAAAQLRVAVAHQGVRDVQAQFSPVVSAQSAISTTTIDTGASPSTTWNIQAVLSWSLWDGGNRYGLLRDTRALEDEAQQRFESLRRGAQVQIEQSRRGVEVAEQSRKVAADARALAADTDRLTQAGYVAGAGTSLELVSAAAALRQAEIGLALQEFTVVRAKLLAVLTLATCPW